MTQDEQRTLIQGAKAKLLRWADERGMPLHRIEFVLPLMPSDFSLSAWFFFETDEQLQRAQEVQWTDQLASQFNIVLRELGYAPERLPEISFRFDSHENVVRDYAESYFYRLR